MDFAPISRDTCPGCGRPMNKYYEERKVHMAASFRAGVPVFRIANAYGMSMDWCMKLIKEQLGDEAVLMVQEQWWKTEVSDGVES